MAKRYRKKAATKKPAKAIVKRVQGLSPSLVTDVRRIIESARDRVAVAVNSELVLSYWRVGRRVRQDVLKGERAEYGENIVHALSAQLAMEYGRGFSEKS